jgi:hypothetical protein
MVGAQ